MGGSQNLRAYWPHYLSQAHVLVFVVDSVDRSRLLTARQELHTLLATEPQLPLVVLANKQVGVHPCVCLSQLPLGLFAAKLSLPRAPSRNSDTQNPPTLAKSDLSGPVSSSLHQKAQLLLPAPRLKSFRRASRQQPAKSPRGNTFPRQATKRMPGAASC